MKRTMIKEIESVFKINSKARWLYWQTTTNIKRENMFKLIRLILPIYQNQTTVLREIYRLRLFLKKNMEKNLLKMLATSTFHHLSMSITIGPYGQPQRITVHTAHSNTYPQGESK